MIVKIPFKREMLRVNINLPEKQILVARSKAVPSRSIEENTIEALENPIGQSRLGKKDLRGKRISVMVDDSHRPTPAYRVLPILIDELKEAGASDRDIMFVIARGLHTPGDTEEQIISKVGKEVFDKYDVIVHNAYDPRQLTFIGISDYGNPVFINKRVAESDYKVCVGRIFPHGDCGYEGGAKMVLPGISSLETVMHNHNFFASPKASPGTLYENPGRMDADQVGVIAGIDYILNFVIGVDGNPQGVKGFAGDILKAHRTGIEWGDANVWGAEIGEKADITIVSPGAGQQKLKRMKATGNAQRGTKKGGTIIYLAEDDRPMSSEERREKMADRHFLIRKELETLPVGEVLRRKERAIMGIPEDWWDIDSVSNEKAKKFRYNQTVIHCLGKISEKRLAERGWTHAESVDEAVEMAIKRHGKGARVLILPEGTTTLPMERFHTYQPG